MKLTGLVPLTRAEFEKIREELVRKRDIVNAEVDRLWAIILAEHKIPWWKQMFGKKDKEKDLLQDTWNVAGRKRHLIETRFPEVEDIVNLQRHYSAWVREEFVEVQECFTADIDMVYISLNTMSNVMALYNYKLDV